MSSIVQLPDLYRQPFELRQSTMLQEVGALPDKLTVIWEQQFKTIGLAC